MTLGLILRSPPNGSARSAARWQAPAGVSKDVHKDRRRLGLMVRDAPSALLTMRDKIGIGCHLLSIT